MVIQKILSIIKLIKVIPEIINSYPKLSNIFKKIQSILKGWYYKIFNKNSDLSRKRMAICKKCHSRVHIDIVGDICDECGCVLSAKTRVKDEKCELNKWYKL